jgi:hypothetical protein
MLQVGNTVILQKIARCGRGILIGLYQRKNVYVTVVDKLKRMKNYVINL